MAKKVIEAVKKVVAPKKEVEPKVEEEVVVDDGFAKRHPGAIPGVIYE